MGRIDLGSDFPSFVLIHLFKDAMAKLGRSRKATIAGMDYDAVEGFTVTNQDGVKWKVEVNAKVVIPQELKDQRIPDEKTTRFCVECTAGVPEDRSTCAVCEYLGRI